MMGNNSTSDRLLWIGIISNIILAITGFYKGYVAVFNSVPDIPETFMIPYLIIAFVHFVILFIYFSSKGYKKIVYFGLPFLAFWLFYKVLFVLGKSDVFLLEKTSFWPIMNLIYPIIFVLLGLCISIIIDAKNSMLRSYGIFMAIFYSIYVTIATLNLNGFYYIKMFKTIMPIILVVVYFNEIRKKQTESEALDSNF